MAKSPSAARVVSFTITFQDAALVRKIVDRAKRENLLGGRTRKDLNMDLAATHANGCPIDLSRLLDADLFNFSHDVVGIVRHLDRCTGQLTNCFVPRMAAIYSQSDDVESKKRAHTLIDPCRENIAARKAVANG